ncbi:DUF192 domain-containing protein [Aurantiacibacter poecillastricola]|uniref:DUF192 domain-containing protein n=1 Tax=Aurantiacibacter poecillastricola TaxID=3064385 RepID=UPI00273F8D60|nr:DUF192 domain-containing protein [Aurantiacibacter sp. 219JJ12-13]MDP5260104.1 DUF192 domain-containing protein [Aurantiacibacter sp. 219JJ12-13]
MTDARLIRTAIAALLGTMIAACTPQAAEQAPEPTGEASSAHPESGLEVVPVTVTSGEETYTFLSEVADTPEAQARGLMFRTEMGPDEGMIFPYEPAQSLSFWMRNTVLPLDIIFIGPDGRILNIAEGVPYNEESVHSDGPAIAVLELNRGRAQELGIGPGDLVEW